MSEFLQTDEEAFAQILAHKTEKNIDNELKRLQDELDKALARKDRVSRLYEKLFEDHTDGTVEDEWFAHMSRKYEMER